MIPSRVINAVDVHAEGQAGRVLFGSHAYAKGETFAEKFEYARAHLDWLRFLLLREPRGYPATAVNLVVPATRPDADFGVIMIEQGGVKPMSGSNMICTVTAALETGFVAMTEPVTLLAVETGAGLIKVAAQVDGTKVTRVTLENVPAFALALDHPVQVHGFGTVHVDLVFGGQIYVQARAAELGIGIVPDNARELASAAIAVLAATREQLPVTHPLNPAIRGPQLPMLYGPSDTPGADGRNTVVIPTGAFDPSDPRTWVGAIDRSPCGTGTSGRMAARYARGEQGLGETFVHESIIGSQFIGTIKAETSVGGYRAIVPTISGRGWIHALSQFILDATDPYPAGYTVGDIWGPGVADTESSPEPVHAIAPSEAAL